MSLGWFDHIEPPRTTVMVVERAVWSQFGEVQLYRTFSNHCDLGGSRPTGKVRVSLGWFDLTEPPRNTVMKGDAGIQGRFECTEPPRTTVTKGKQAYRERWSELGGGLIPPNLCDEWGSRYTGNVGVSSCMNSSSRGFGVDEPSRTFGMVRPHQTPSNYCDEGGSWPEG